MPFWSELVCEHYPQSDIFNSGRKATITELKRFVRIILTEGIPFACVTCPMAYEFGRHRAAERIGVDPKQLSVTGSARIGYSLHPDKFARAYDPANSDIDLFLIDEECFVTLAQEYTDFLRLFESGKIVPRNEREKEYWTANKEFCPNDIRKGFLDQKYVPTFNRFQMPQRLGDAAHRFKANVNSASGKELVRSTSLRTYRDWNAAINQISFSLMRTLERRGAQQ